MSEDRPRKFDLAKMLAPVRVQLPSLGTAALDLRTASFLSWFEEGRKQDRWTGGEDFVRTLLKERGVAAEQVEPPSPEAVDALSPEEVETAAAIILDEAGPSLLPRRIVEEDSGEAPPREQDDPDPLSNPPDEPSSAGLLRVVSAYADYHQAQSRRFLETVRRAGAVNDLLRKPDSLSTILKTQSLIARGIIGSDSYRQSVLAFDRQHSILKSIERLTSSSLFEEHRRLAAQLSLPSSPLRQVQDAVRGLVGLQAWRDLRERDRLFADRLGWVRAIDSQLRLGLPASVFASLAAVQLGGGIVAEAAAAQAASMIRPGFQTAANLALEGLAARGAVAELLRRYDDEAEEAPALEAVRETVTQLDEEEASPEAFMRLFDRAWDIIVSLLGKSPDLIRNPAFVNWLALLVAIAGTSVTAYQVFGPPPPEIISRLDETNTQLRSVNAELSAKRQRDEAARHIRYVHHVVNLRAEPHRQGQLIRLVYPDQPVRILDARGEWARVEVFDYGSDAPVTGWMSRRYLRVSPQAF